MAETTPLAFASDPPPVLAMIGLGRMGGNMARRLARHGAVVHAWDADASARDALRGEAGVVVHDTLEAAIAALVSPRLAWVMLPAGAATDGALAALRTLLSAGDVLVDGGNANYQHSEQRGRELASLGLHFVDCGVSGGVWGLTHGYCLMFGAAPDALPPLLPVVARLAPAPDRGWLHCGPVGSGHFAKMIHNGIEYGMMQAFAEGFALLEGKREYGFDLAALAETWRHGSVVRSWLLDLSAEALADPTRIEEVAPFVADSGEGRWTVEEAVRQGTPTPVIALALMSRFASQGRGSYANRLLALMRQGFGGHPVTKA